MSDTPAAIPTHASATHVTQLVERENVRAGVNARLQNILVEQREFLRSLGDDTDLLIDAWDTLVSGGKRLRAAFAYWGFRAAEALDAQNPDGSSPHAQELLNVGAALELFQAAALFHDDVMDRSDSRRGKPTAHKTFEALHIQDGYVGDADNYGTSVAILLGDLSLVASETEFRKAVAGFPAENRARALEYFDAMRSVVTVGQFLDIHAQVAPWDQDLDAAQKRAFNVIRTKTSSYSVTYPILIGAALAGATEETIGLLTKFALPVGIAYQLIDDLLGAFGDAETTGKPTGDDLREGKRTVLVIEALKRLDDQDADFVRSSLGRHDLSDSDVSRLLKLIDESGAAARTRQMVEEHAAEGLGFLAQADLNTEGKAMLTALAQYALKRDF
ncbi:polyprenyl synthetase family protein [Timonella senegalensis]|uniref:polyprenyl synthetase family protein n=1 Tax=Timonella senegalensis TaxID=1465825 RepID=UPI002FDD27A8